jgi:hypothetical protein
LLLALVFFIGTGIASLTFTSCLGWRLKSYTFHPFAASVPGQGSDEPDLPCQNGRFSASSSPNETVLPIAARFEQRT